MNLIQELWADESGLVMSAEAVTIGTVGVLGSIVGMNAVGSAVNDELKEMASAIRSLDQSYAFRGHRGCGAWTAGSAYIQPDVRHSLAEINGEAPVDIKAIQQQIEDDRRQILKPAPQPQPHVEPAKTPVPNQIPVPEAKTGETELQKSSPETPQKSEATVVPARP